MWCTPVALQMTVCFPVAAVGGIAADIHRSRQQSRLRAALPAGRQKAAAY